MEADLFSLLLLTDSPLVSQARFLSFMFLDLRTSLWGRWVMETTKGRLHNHMFSLSSLSRSLSIAGSFLRSTRPTIQPAHTAHGPLGLFSRAASRLAPRQVKHIKRHKGRVPIPLGGSTKGTTLAYGEFGIRIKGNGHRLTAKQLSTAEEVIKRKARVLKGLKVYLRVFPDIPVCIKVRYMSRSSAV